MIVSSFGCELSVLYIHRSAHEASDYSGININEVIRHDQTGDMIWTHLRCRNLLLEEKRKGRREKSVWVEERDWR